MLTDTDERTAEVEELVEKWDETQRHFGRDTPIAELCRSVPELANRVASRVHFLKVLDDLFPHDPDDDDSDDRRTQADIDLPDRIHTDDDDDDERTVRKAAKDRRRKHNRKAK